MPDSRGHNEVRLWNGGLVIPLKRFMSFDQQASQTVQLAGRKRVGGSQGASGLGHDVPHPRNQWWWQPAFHLGQIVWGELCQVLESGPPFTTECESFLAFPPALVESSPGQAVR